MYGRMRLIVKVGQQVWFCFLCVCVRQGLQQTGVVCLQVGTKEGTCLDECESQRGAHDTILDAGNVFFVFMK